LTKNTRSDHWLSLPEFKAFHGGLALLSVELFQKLGDVLHCKKTLQGLVFIEATSRCFDAIMREAHGIIRYALFTRL
jgi:hypothetical protein